MLYVPGLTSLEEITSADFLSGPAGQRPGPSRRSAGAELAAAGVRRISVGGAFAFVALGAVSPPPLELRDQGTYGFWEQAKVGGRAAGSAFTT